MGKKAVDRLLRASEAELDSALAVLAKADQGGGDTTSTDGDNDNDLDSDFDDLDAAREASDEQDEEEEEDDEEEDEDEGTPGSDGPDGTMSKAAGVEAGFVDGTAMFEQMASGMTALNEKLDAMLEDNRQLRAQNAVLSKAVGAIGRHMQLMSKAQVARLDEPQLPVSRAARVVVAPVNAPEASGKKSKFTAREVIAKAEQACEKGLIQPKTVGYLSALIPEFGVQGAVDKLTPYEQESIFGREQ